MCLETHQNSQNSISQSLCLVTHTFELHCILSSSFPFFPSSYILPISLSPIQFYPFYSVFIPLPPPPPRPPPPPCSVLSLSFLCSFSLVLFVSHCLCTSFTLTVASLITIEEWPQSSFFFFDLYCMYLWELVTPVTREISRGSNVNKYSHILYSTTFSLERIRHVEKHCHSELPLYCLSRDF